MSPVTINVKASGDKKFSITIEAEKTILDFKKMIAEETSVPVDLQRLIYSGRVLKDNDIITDYKIANGNTVHMVRGSQSKVVATTAAHPPLHTTTNQPTTQTPIIPPTPTNNYLMNPGGLDPGMANQMLQNPAFAQYMSNVLQNPAVLDSIIQTNPQLASMGPEVRQLMQSPQFRQMLTNPETIRQMATMSSMFSQSATLEQQQQQRFGAQLRQLNEMGLQDNAKNINALTATGGDVNAAIEMLFNNEQSPS
ncbi:ubiquitin-related domain-containing protein [Sporodiniella umbellata]|nr:ubiquitin-related domain-containing protein [Sporodiniella umbellata]